MPEAGAKEFVAAIEQKYGQNRPKVVVLTGEIDGEGSNELAEIRGKFDGFLAKPFEEDDIINVLKQIYPDSSQNEDSRRSS